MRMAAFSSELAVLTHCLRDLTVPADLWMLKSRQALAMWLKPTMKFVHIELWHSKREIASNLLAVRWMQHYLLRNPVPICANKLTALPCYNNNFCCSLWKQKLCLTYVEAPSKVWDCCGQHYMKDVMRDHLHQNHCAYQNVCHIKNTKTVCEYREKAP